MWNSGGKIGKERRDGIEVDDDVREGGCKKTKERA